jgi:ER degradation enhancer, mannosidase alpha-like 2
MRSPAIIILIAILLIATFCPSAVAQTTFTPEEKARLAGRVREEFVHSWNGYKKYAWGQDALLPLSKKGTNWYSKPLVVSMVDALDTMIMMGLTAEADSTRAYIVAHLSFDQDMYVKAFEINIRMLGGLLSSYQLTGDERLLKLAKDLADRLIPIFKSPTGLPYVEVNLRTGAVRGTKTNPAEIGTYLLDFGTLSHLTGEVKYYNYAKNAILRLYERRSAIGLYGDGIDCETGEWTSTRSHISACIDSYFEYLAKSALMFDDTDCATIWEESHRALNTYLTDSTATGIWYGQVDMNTGKRTATTTGALDAFYPAVLVLASDVPQAIKLQESFFTMWKRHGLEPEQFDYLRMEAKRPGYYLNPEIMESAFYLYRATQRDHYLEMAKVFLDSLMTYCRTDAGYAELKNVVTKEKMDRMETYFLAETLKYLYLIFAPENTVDLGTVFFNTEAHPLKRTW